MFFWKPKKTDYEKAYEDLWDRYMDLKDEIRKSKAEMRSCKNVCVHCQYGLKLPHYIFLLKAKKPVKTLCVKSKRVQLRKD